MAVQLHLASDCRICLTVDASRGEFTPLQTSDCTTTPNTDKLWLMAQDAASGGGWWCLASNPSLCVEEGGALVLSTELETSPYQQFAYEDELRTNEGSEIIGGGSDECVTLITGGGVQMTGCVGADRQRWRAVEEGRPLCPGDNNGGGGSTDGGEDDGSGIGNGGGGGGGFLGDETTLPDPSRILLFLENGCNQCIGVDDAEVDAPLKLVSCKDTPNMLRLWSLDLLVGSSIAQSVCLEFDPALCIVETDGGELRLGNSRSKSAYILNQFIDDQMESLEEVGSCIAFVGGDGTIALEECSTSKSGQYWTKQGEAYWTEECANTPPPSPRPTAKPTRGPAPPSVMSEEVPWWTILLVVAGAMLVGGAVYYLASAYFSSKRRKQDMQRRRRSRNSNRSRRSEPAPGIS